MIEKIVDFAFLLPAYVLSDFMGIHKEDRSKVVQWSVDFVDFFNVVAITGETTQRMTRSYLEMRDYTRHLLVERRTNPRDDFLGTLVNAANKEGAFTEDEIIGSVARKHIIHFLWRPFLKDPQDDHVLELAVEAGCGFIVTHNVRDFSGSERFGIRVVTPRAVLRVIGGMP